MRKVSVIIPCFNEQDNIAGLYEALRTLFAQNAQYEWEAIMIDDGSCDGTLSEIKRINRTDRRIRYVSLSRNFGKENAMLAGFDCAGGDCAVIMDADLQHPPSLIPMMLRHWEEGFDDVYAERRNRGRESWLRQRLSMAYYRMLQRMAKIEILPNVGDFRLLDRKCIDSMRRLRETQRYTKGLYCWIGFRKKKIVFDQGDRVNGCSSFSYMRLFDLAVEGITSYTTAPLRISTWGGHTRLVRGVHIYVLRACEDNGCGRPRAGLSNAHHSDSLPRRHTAVVARHHRRISGTGVQRDETQTAVHSQGDRLGQCSG